MGQLGFFDVEKKLQALSELGEPLERLAQAIDRKRFKRLSPRPFAKSERAMLVDRCLITA